MDRVITVLLALLLAVPGLVSAQIGKGNQGNTAVYSQPTAVQGSAAIVDASAFSGTDLCNMIYTILTGPKYPGGGSVIDARGVTNPALLDCKSGTPWIQNDSSPTHDVPSSNTATILLPAATITIHTTWVLPDYTKIIGQGNQTIISAAPGFAPPGWDTNSGGTGMIEMGAFATTNAWGNFPAPGPYPCISNGPPCLCPIAKNGPGCFGVGVQDLVLDGSQLAGTSVNGIFNSSTQEMGYVDHVTMNNIEGIGLRIYGVNAGGSGPYSNIAFNAGSNAKSGTIANGGTACVDVQALIRGIHGLTCTAAGLSGSPAAAVYVDGGLVAASNDGGGNTIEDVHVDGFQDGVLLGSQSSSPGYILTNINASNANRAKDLKNVVHICGSPAVAPCPSIQFVLFNEALNGVSSSAAGINSIEDDLTQTILSDSSVGMYIVGAPFTNGSTVAGYSRFTTSPRVPTWGAGAPTALGSCPSSANGSLFSRTNGSSGSTLYVCAPTGSAASTTSSAWRAIK